MGLFDTNDEPGRLSGMAKAIDKASNSPEAFRPVGAPSNAPLDIRPPAAQPSWFDNLRDSNVWSSIPTPFQGLLSSLYGHFGQIGNNQQAPTPEKPPVPPAPQTQPPGVATRSSLLPPATSGGTQQPQLSKTTNETPAAPPMPAVMAPQAPPPQLPPQFPQLPPLPAPSGMGSPSPLLPTPPVPVGANAMPPTTPFGSQANWGAPVNQVSGI